MRFFRQARHGLVRAILQISAWLARSEAREVWSRRFMRALANGVIRRHQIRMATDLPDLGAQWQRAFPSAHDHPIVRVTDQEVEAEIHTNCPLRGTGDAAACHRMMEFDRHLVARAGGDFEVLESQAVTGGSRCRVVLRLHQP